MTDASKLEATAPASGSTEATNQGEPQTPAEDVLAVLTRLEAEVDRRSAVLRALRPLGKADAYSDLKKLRGRLEKLDATLDPDLLGICGIEDMLGGVRTFQQTAGQRRRKELGRELKAACEASGLPLRIVTREDPIEVRIPPLAIVLDFDKGLADIRFARQPLAQCGATVADILDAHKKTVAALETGFDPGQFFEDCLVAYKMSLVAMGRKRGDRVELNDFMASMALQRQSKKFHEEPVSANYRGYSRAQFAYDVLRLRKASALTQGGRRINFGVATGTTATKKGRVLYMEDGDGKGEYKLTIYFTEVGS
ncbi:MAG: hypothetical protein ACI841_000760 [Planctomycetota bacterium]|jgi:hypothetical protein